MALDPTLYPWAHLLKENMTVGSDPGYQTGLYLPLYLIFQCMTPKITAAFNHFSCFRIIHMVNIRIRNRMFHRENALFQFCGIKNIFYRVSESG